MVYETCYESGRKPFLPDSTRGYWATSNDFIYACLGLAFKFDILSIRWLSFHELNVLDIVPYLICLGLFVAPIFVIQSFMGQFSSSGFISAFRISPLFKGIGYISLVFNFGVLTYFSSFAAIPLLYFLNSFRPILPWSCEEFANWSSNLTELEYDNICNVKHIKEYSKFGKFDINDKQIYHIPSLIFFENQFGSYKMDGFSNTEDDSISWTLVSCTLIVWSIISLIFYKFFSIEKFGKLLRYAIWLTLSLMIICLTRFLLLPGTDKIVNNIKPEYVELDRLLNSFPSIPIFAMSSFGSGWGSIISLSSFNKFKTNIMSFNWIICIGQMFIFVAFGIIIYLLERHLNFVVDGNVLVYHAHRWILYLSSGSVIANMELPNMWSLLFYGMLTIGTLIAMVTQIYSLLVSLFDEFETLRSHKITVTFSMIAVWTLCSLFFCTRQGIMKFVTLTTMDAILTQSGINLLLLLVVLWIYGRQRFQRDIEFMLGQRFATWKVYMLRFIAPIFLLLILLLTGGYAFYEHIYFFNIRQIPILMFIVIPWYYIPTWSIVSMLQTTGSFCMRFKRCCRPIDWYPAEIEDRQRYEDTMGNMDITQQLNEVADQEI